LGAVIKRVIKRVIRSVIKLSIKRLFAAYGGSMIDKESPGGRRIPPSAEIYSKKQTLGTLMAPRIVFSVCPDDKSWVSMWSIPLKSLPTPE
jgi:hypothetical protein